MIITVSTEIRMKVDESEAAEFHCVIHGMITNIIIEVMVMIFQQNQVLKHHHRQPILVHWLHQQQQQRPNQNLANQVTRLQVVCK